MEIICEKNVVSAGIFMFCSYNTDDNSKFDFYYFIVAATDSELEVWEEDVIASMIMEGALKIRDGKFMIQWKN